MRGQAIAEYAVLIGVVVAAVMGMQLYAKRAIQAGVKVASDQLSPFADDPDGMKAQLAGNQYEAGDRTTAVFAVGTTLENRSAVKTNSRQSTAVLTEAADAGGVTRTIAPGDENVTTTVGALKDCSSFEWDDTRIDRWCEPNTAQYSEVITDVR